jgi:uncharacterized protein YggE
MPHIYDESTIRITASGRTDTRFLSATFKAEVHAVATTGPDAKKLAKDRIDAILGVVSEFGERAGIDQERLKTSFSVDVAKEYDGNRAQKFVGYAATYSITFSASKVEETTALHDALTSIPGVESSSPVFRADNSPAVHNAAFKAAAKAAQVMFEGQCEALGLTASSYRVRTWAVEEAQHHGKTMTLSGGPKASAVGLEPGKAVFKMNVTFVYGL